jgi:dTDP-4-amino-4,6-dideoxygalactose transaminase
MSDGGLHLYSDNVGLVKHASVDGAGFPWKLAENAGWERKYDKGNCPAADSLFDRSILIPIPSYLQKRDENDIIHAFGKVLPVVLPQ